jgi:hypothetical protein
MKCFVTGEPGTWLKDPGSEHASWFRIQQHPQRKWGDEVVLNKPLRRGSTIQYAGVPCTTNPNNDYSYEVFRGRFIDPLGLPKKSIALLFNDDHRNLLEQHNMKKAVWVATSHHKGEHVLFRLQHNADAGAVCVVNYDPRYGAYDLEDDYIDSSQPDAPTIRDGNR